MSSDSTQRALLDGVLVGLVGTATMTAAQTAYHKAMDVEPSSTPAEVAKRVIRGVLQREVSVERTDTLNNAMHWLYGTGWGTLCGLAARRPTLGIAFGTLVWGVSLVELPAMRLSPPVWEPRFRRSPPTTVFTWSTGSRSPLRSASCRDLSCRWGAGSLHHPAGNLTAVAPVLDPWLLRVVHR